VFNSRHVAISFPFFTSLTSAVACAAVPSGLAVLPVPGAHHVVLDGAGRKGPMAFGARQRRHCDLLQDKRLLGLRGHAPTGELGLKWSTEML
jgi:hypothetical protein